MTASLVMFRTWALTLLCMGSSACLQFGPSDEEEMSNSDGVAPFEGTWSHRDPIAPCTQFMLFFNRDGVNNYEIDLACNLDRGGIGVQVESGEYSVVDDGLTMFMPKRATCQSGLVVAHSQTIAQQGEIQLNVKNAQGVIQSYDRVSQTGLGPNVTLGCFSTNGAFTAAPLSDL